MVPEAPRACRDRRTAVITGSRSGIGAAVTALLRERGWSVLGIDLQDADVIADLSRQEDRRQAADAVARTCPDGISALIACAGIVSSSPAVISINFFGATEMATLLRSQLLKRPHPRAVLISSLAATFPVDAPTVQACLDGDEAAALRRAATLGDEQSKLYASSKQALSLWVRRAAILPEWAGSGILLNAIGPGSVLTQMTLPLLRTEAGRAMLHKVTPIAVRDFASPDAIAPLLAFLVGPENSYIVGQTLFIDGGAQAILRPGQV